MFACLAASLPVLPLTHSPFTSLSSPLSSSFTPSPQPFPSPSKRRRKTSQETTTISDDSQGPPREMRLPMFDEDIANNTSSAENGSVSILIRSAALQGDQDVLGIANVELYAAFYESPTFFVSPILMNTRYNGYVTGYIHIQQ